MKNVKYLGFVGLGCAALLLTGCGGSGHTLTCTKEEDNETQELVYEFDDKEEKVIGAKMHMTTVIPDDSSDEEIEQAKSLLEGMFCSSDMFEDCEATVSGNKLEFNASVSESGLNDDTFSGGTMKEVKEKYEKDGYTCK